MEDQRSTSFFRFEDLRVYHKALEYYGWLINQVKNADEFASKTLLTPLLDTAAKIAINIAEGSSNHNKATFVEYLKAAKAQVRQCVVFTTMAQQNGLFDQQQAEFSRNILIEMTKMVGAMVFSLQKPSNREDRNLKTNNTDKEQSFNSDIKQDDIASEFDFSY
ncbi:MAG: four helix bundle protein [Bacteroidales bacterium]|nr:four helix bundle protein [Bacteroidales bacterium]